MISAALREAGLRECCKAHGLRKAAARRRAAAGGSASEIAAITGHNTLADVARYARAATKSGRRDKRSSGSLKTEAANRQNIENNPIHSSRRPPTFDKAI